MIKVEKLYKCFGKQKVLEDLNLNVKKGSVYGLLGPNGAGKTTLIKHLAGIYRPDRGLIEIGGITVNNADAKDKMFYIPDELYFFGQYSIDEAARFSAGIYPNWNWSRYNLLKEAFPINTGKKISRLSKGMQKQVAFWLGISTMPSLMIMDEPVDGLDPVMRKQVWSLMLQDVAEREMTVLVSSHNLRELEDVCDSIGILHSGRIVVEKELDDLKSNVHKLQLAFRGNPPQDFLKGYEILNHSQKGNIHLFILRGEKDELLSEISRQNPLIMDMLPLTLEEIFIYELGGIGYEIKNILI